MATQSAQCIGDPLSDIDPALLNSVDIQRYQAACGLLTEGLELRRLKPASYEIVARGDIYSWDSSSQDPRVRRLEKGQKFDIPPNSIVYAMPDVGFRLPEFIAMRFNLRIKLVHQGLLLGTGPLVDPGFEGRLLIPLHNLTSQSIELDADKGLIWVEFTKLSRLVACNDGKYIPVKFSDDKKKLSAQDYFSKAGKGPFSSSLFDILERSNKLLTETQEANRKSAEIERKLRLYSRVGIVAGVIAVASLIASVVGVHVSSNAFVRDATQALIDSNASVSKDIDSRLQAYQERIKNMEATIEKGQKSNLQTLRSSAQESRK